MSPKMRAEYEGIKHRHPDWTFYFGTEHNRRKIYALHVAGKDLYRLAADTIAELETMIGEITTRWKDNIA